MLPVDYTADRRPSNIAAFSMTTKTSCPVRSIRPRGIPFIRGRVPDEWYERYFETALRLKVNMVAPYVRTTCDFAVQKMASDWGLYYTSHHYDTLLSNPTAFTISVWQVNGVAGSFDWLRNRTA